MTISVACGCGKRFSAPPHLAGKQVSCPACQSPLAIPAPSAAAKISVACQCGKRFSAKPELAGKRVKCPACQSPLTIPGGAVASPAPAPAAPIVVACQCGQRFQAPPHLLGQQVQCPVCRQPIHVTNAAAPVPALDPFPAQPAPMSGDDDLWGDIPLSTAHVPSIPTLPQAPAMPSASANSDLSNPYIAAAVAQKATRQDDEDSWGNGKIISGIAMMLGAVIWFCGGLAVGIIFFYPPFLFIAGVVALATGIGQKMSR